MNHHCPRIPYKSEQYSSVTIQALLLLQSFNWPPVMCTILFTSVTVANQLGFVCLLRTSILRQIRAKSPSERIKHESHTQLAHLGNGTSGVCWMGGYVVVVTAHPSVHILLV